mgnify:CR=1 FL=1
MVYYDSRYHFTLILPKISKLIAPHPRFRVTMEMVANGQVPSGGPPSSARKIVKSNCAKIWYISEWFFERYLAFKLFPTYRRKTFGNFNPLTAHKAKFGWFFGKSLQKQLFDNFEQLWGLCVRQGVRDVPKVFVSGCARIISILLNLINSLKVPQTHVKSFLVKSWSPRSAEAWANRGPPPSPIFRIWDFLAPGGRKMCYPLGNHCTIIQRINKTTKIKPIGTKTVF